MADQSNQQRQQSNSYPSPHSYPSPSMQPTYTYPPPQGQGNPEPYRGSPQGSNMNLPPLNLPPIRVQDGQAQQQQGPPGQQPMGSPLPPSQHGMPQYYGHPGQHHPAQGPPMNMGGAPHMGMRYQLPPQGGEQRMMSGGRHKKEIKRRTKTGCLTCRKRRIKCDEAHPICRNCQKSKRDCLGYDPIFKQQPGPAQIQPAPNSAPHQVSVPASAPPTAAAPYSGQVPQGYAPAASTGYPPPAPVTAAHHENFNAIDPALAGQDPAMHGAPQYNGGHALNPALRAPTPRRHLTRPPSKVSHQALDIHNPRAYHSDSHTAKRIKISELFPIGHHNPPEVPQRPSPIPQELDDDFAKIFGNDYCAGLDQILETRWFTTGNNALARVFSDKQLHEEAVHFVETVKYRTTSADMGGIFSQEARLIWHMLGVCKQPALATNGTNGTIPVNAENEDASLSEVRARFDILEALLTNQNLESNPLRQISYPSDLAVLKKAEVDFWEQLGNFVMYADNDSAPPGAVDYALGTMRTVLNAIEVRDALYSIAIARHLGNRIRGFPNSLPPQQDAHPETDLNKLQVAMGFISYECRSGSQQVTARICDMAMLSWTVSRTP
ncbi:hypothetical protein P154DRAFT_593408 [Amniculicola lignicola CBS 123094]|uniref:Zn(2)-C6 fungal-type domain-containing protein n=1 Tax=Amniculicola lignicola CBS 123094 TaxID=1392246 RepID=A0A6A5WV22_9PLEO|nr:hypothetical protein P154DRAFT_593408 [Amniculicola lignicola CBS 123094]